MQTFRSLARRERPSCIPSISPVKNSFIRTSKELIFFIITVCRNKVKKKEEAEASSFRRIKDCNAEIKVTDYDSIFRVEINIKSNVVVGCAYTLEDVDYVVKARDELDFTDEELDEDDDTLIQMESTIIDLKPHIYSILVSAIPIKVVKKGAKPPKDGNGYRVLSEDEFLNEKDKKTDSRWDILDDIEF